MSTQAKPTTKPSTKPSTNITNSPRTEKEKIESKLFMNNPTSGKQVLISGAIGKKLLAKEPIVAKTTLNESLKFFIGTLQDAFPEVLTDEFFKSHFKKFKRPTAAEKKEESYEEPTNFLPREFPSVWGGSGKAPKTPKDPNHPVKNKNSYQCFQRAIKGEKLSKEEKQLKWADIKKEFGDNSIYHQEANKDKERYEAEMVPWLEDHPQEVKSPSSPKKSPTAYHLFCKDFKNEREVSHPEEAKQMAQAMAGAAWKEASDLEKKPFIEEAEKLKKEFVSSTESVSTVGDHEELAMDDGESSDDDDLNE
jgi:hypothetical protein